MGLLDSITEWLKKPFESGQSAWRWMLFVGLIIVAAGMWQIVLLHIAGVVREVD